MQGVPTTRIPRFNRHLFTATLEVQKFLAEDEGLYECVWTRKHKKVVIKKHIYKMTETAKVEILERSPRYLRLKEGEPFSLSARSTIYPKEDEGYRVQWSRTYKLAAHVQNLSKLILDEDDRKISTVNDKNGYYTERLDVGSFAVTTDMSGT